MIMQHKLGSAFFHQAVPEIFLLHEFGVELDTVFSGKAVIPLKAEKTFHGSQFHVGGAKPFLFPARRYRSRLSFPQNGDGRPWARYFFSR